MRSVLVIGLLIFAPLLHAQLPSRIITDNDLQGDSYTWSSDTTYVLDGLVVLEDGGELAIEAGTIIRAKSVPGDGSPTSALIIARGARIEARGDYLNPIIFTSEGDDIEDPSDLLQTDRGLWGGLVILGDAPVLDADSNLLELQYGTMDDGRLMFGGNDPSHSAGTIKSVSIRHGGAGGFAGLTLAGCGNGMYVDYVESFAGASDGIHWIGGTVDTRHLTMNFNAGDAFKWDAGYRGRGQFWFAIQSEDQAGHAINGQGAFSAPIIYNVSLVGPGMESSAGPDVAVRFADQSGGILGMSAIAQFPGFAIEVEDLPGEEDSYALLKTGELDLRSNIWGEFGSQLTDSTNVIFIGDEASDPSAQVLKEILKGNNFLQLLVFTQVSRSPDESIDMGAFFDASFQPLVDTAFYPNDNFFRSQIGWFCYGRGAFLEREAWWLRHWSALYKDLYLEHPCLDGFRNSMSRSLDIPATSDTIYITCDQIQDLKEFSYVCRNFQCNLLHQSLGVAMRMRRKKPRGTLMIPSGYCYEEQLIFQGYEFPWVDNPEISDIGTILDSFQYIITAFVTDTVAPTFEILPCDTCTDFPFEVLVRDCDTAWIIDVSHDTVMTEQKVVHSWVATDSCNNISDLIIEEPLNAVVVSWYQDKDSDSYGDESFTIEWSGPLPGYVNRGGDCDDNNANRYPGNVENIEDALDNNCDGRGELDLCRIADTLAVLPVCEPAFYGWNEATFDSLSQDFRCQGLSGYFIDGWLKAVVPSSGSLQFSLTPMDEDSTRIFFSSLRMSIYTGNCSNYQTVNCDDLTFDGIVHHISADNLMPGDTVLLHLINSEIDLWPFSICAIDPNPVTQIEDQLVGLSIKGYPNPTSSEHFVEVTSRLKSKIQVDLLDVYGRSLEQTKVQSIDIGVNIIRLEMQTSPGMYFVRCRTSDKTYTYPIIISE